MSWTTTRAPGLAHMEPPATGPETPASTPWPTARTQTVINVRDGAYGAVGDGNADDRPAIQAALDSVPAWGGIVYLPAGTYKIQSALQLGSNTELRGDGPLTVIAPSYPAPLTIPAFSITNNLTTGNTNIVLRDFQLSRAGTNVEHGIALNGVTNLICDGLEIVGEPSTTSGALAISGLLEGGATPLPSSEIRIHNCRFDNTGDFGVQLSYVNGVTISDCAFTNCYREAIGVEPQAGCTATNITISSCNITQSTTQMGTGTGLLIITESSGGTVGQVAVTAVNITGATITGDISPGVNVLTATERPISFTGVNIAGTNAMGYSIGSAVYATQGVKITGGSVTNCNAANNASYTGAGISLRQAGFCTITGVYIKGTNHTASIEETLNTVGYNLIQGCDLRDSTPFILYAGSKTNVENCNVLGGQANQVGSQRCTFGSTYTMHSYDPPIIACTSTAAANTLTLPAVNSVPVGRIYTIVDETDGAATHNITIDCAGTDTFTGGATSKTISTNGGDLRLYSNGTNWQTV